MNDTFPHASSNSKPSVLTAQCFSDTCFISRRRSEWNCQKTHEAIADSRLINCPCACCGLATKHNAAFPENVRIIKPRNYQLPGKEPYLLGQEMAMNRIYHSSVLDDEACKLQSAAHLRQNMLRWAYGDQRNTENLLRCYHPVLRAFHATADSASSKVCRKQFSARGTISRAAWLRTWAAYRKYC